MVLLDFSRVFDTTNRELLLAILHHVGMMPSVLPMCRNYFKNRLLIVRLKQLLSKPCCVQFGVPQGSILGPLLVILNTSVLASIVNHGR